VVVGAMMRSMTLLFGLAASGCLQMPDLGAGHPPCDDHSGCTTDGQLCVAGACWVPHAPCHGLGFTAHPSAARLLLDQTLASEHFRVETWFRWDAQERGGETNQLSTILSLKGETHPNSGFGIFVTEGQGKGGRLPPPCNDVTDGNGSLVAIVQGPTLEPVCLVVEKSLDPNQWHHVALEISLPAADQPGFGRVRLMVDGSHAVDDVDYDASVFAFQREIEIGSEGRVASSGGPFVGGIADILITTDPSQTLIARYPLQVEAQRASDVLVPQLFQYWRSWETPRSQITPSENSEYRMIDDCGCLTAETIYTPACGS
jgi:hypothetical protein